MDLIGVKLSYVIKYHGSRNSIPGDNIFPDEFPDLTDGDGSHNLCLHQLSKVVNHTIRYFLFLVAFGKGPRISMPSLANSREL